jgi:glycosyltransferase involved in cell wall biosynthesis
LSLKILEKKNIKVTIVFSGSSKNNYIKIRENVINLGLEEQVCFIGYVNDIEMKFLYTKASGLVMPTYYGPTNIPPLEAFYLNCPVAISNVYGISEQVQDAALLFDPNNVDEIAHAMSRLWLDEILCDTLRRKGAKLVKNWNPNVFSNKLMDILYAN